MPSPPPGEAGGRWFRIWSQNLNKSLDAQLDFINNLSPRYFNLALIQEPHFDFRGVSRANRAWISVYPPTHAANHRATRAMILVNVNVPRAAWRVVPIPSPDITAIDIFDESFGTIRVVNIYNDGNTDGTL
ncbi:hypothetical protein C8R45DRAFT_814214, partial [Mycena sanguinolenta]